MQSMKVENYPNWIRILKNWHKFQFDIDDMYNKCKEFESATKDANDAR